MGNWFSVVALCSWPFIAGIFFTVKPAGKAAILTILGGFLFLPAGVDVKIPMIPAFDKVSIPNVCALIGCAVLATRPRLKPPSKRLLVYLLSLIYVVSPIATSAFNNDPIFVGGFVVPGVGNYDAISACLSQLIFFLPFLIGWRYIRDIENNEAVLRALVVAGVLYSLGVFFEARMSPVLAAWIYGYSPSSFITSLRYGGYRPSVFLDNGLVLSFFMMTTLLASLALGRAKKRIGTLPHPLVSVYLVAVLVFCKSAGALTYGVIAGSLVTLAKPQTQMKLSVVLVTIALIYPIMRAADIFPTRALVQVAQSISVERAESLEFRFNQEDLLLGKAMQRPFFGWGRYGRNRVFNEESGRDLSVTDGQWIITLGTFGLVGFFAQFGLLAFPVFRASAAFKLAGSPREEVFLAALSLIVALTIVEQLPNASISPWSWLLTGMLLGRSEEMKAAVAIRPRKASSAGPPAWPPKVSALR